MGNGILLGQFLTALQMLPPDWAEKNPLYYSSSTRSQIRCVCSHTTPIQTDTPVFISVLRIRLQLKVSNIFQSNFLKLADKTVT